MSNGRNSTGELLVRKNIISAADLSAIKKHADAKGMTLVSALIDLGIVDEAKLSELFTKNLGIPTVTLHDHILSPDVVQQIPREFAERYGCVAIKRHQRNLVVAMSDPANITTQDELKAITEGMSIEVVFASESSIRTAIAQYYPPLHTTIAEAVEQLDAQLTGDDGEVKTIDLYSSEKESGAQRFVRTTLRTCIELGASDIHIEPQKTQTGVRLRIDGVLQRVAHIPQTAHASVVAIIKILASMDISEKRRPQDGRIVAIAANRKEVAFRVSIIPSVHGEKVVLRLLDSSNLSRSISNIGLTKEELLLVGQSINRPYGMCLVTGPTGSGKTTTLYSVLAELNRPNVNICTAEDPVEYQLPGITQVAVNHNIDLGFAEVLRSFLRQDPDIIMVGEIRDFETAEIAIKAALTGHMVISTLHTNDAASAITRLVNMGLEPYLVAQSVNLVIAQRLLRVLCSACKKEESYTEQHHQRLTPAKKMAPATIFSAKGCPKCNESGYKGRCAIYEILPLTEHIQEAILEGAPASEIKSLARQKSMTTLREAALNKLFAGVTTIEEVERCTAPD